MLFGKKKKRQVPALDTTSTADISFMLLIFFLVTTSLDNDEGLTRYLSPIPQKNEQTLMDVNRNDLMTIAIDANDRLTCNGDTLTAKALEKRVETFVVERGSKHVIAVNTDRQASYDAYFAMQNAIVNGYANARDNMARKEYHKPFTQCTAEQRERITKLCPQRISEANPTEQPEDKSAEQSDMEEGGAE